MSKETKSENYRLVVPLDAFFEGFKPEQGVKVGIEDRRGKITSEVVQLDANGKAFATFSFRERPSGLRLILGPENVSDEDLVGLQTISAAVEARQWAENHELTIPAIKISPYYWWWWGIWCRTYTVNGLVLCPDGSPVPGAVVCAYDVDWWWWWTSQQQVGNCATTDANGAFTITFKWCCGWWPWWWWQFRYWRYEPLLAERILPILQKDPTLGKIPFASPTPNLALFDHLSRGGSTTEARLIRGADNSTALNSSIALEAGSRRTSARGAAIANAGRAGSIDPTVLASLREKLIDRLPAAPELEKLKIWPWWRWGPWADCSPDIIFKVTQDCVEPGKVIVDETIWQAHWDIPTTLNVSLTATDACCIPICTDPADCPDGDCIVIARACDVPVSNIGGNFDAVATPAGYVSPGVGDQPFASNVPIYAVFGTGANVAYYEFEWSTSLAGPWNPMPPTAAGSFSRQYWGPALGGGLVGWYWVPFTFTNISGRNVVESREHFEVNNGWNSLLHYWTYNSDLLMNWLTENNFADGTYYLHVKGWDGDSVSGLSNDRILLMCDTTDENYVVLTIDNRTLDGSDGHPPANTPGHPCGAGTIHYCTMEPDTDIENVSINNISVGPCSNVQASPGNPLVVDFYAYDVDGHLGGYSLIATYGENLYVDLLSLPHTLVPWTPVAAVAVPQASQVGPDYGTARAQGATSPTWHGGGVRLTIADSSLAFPEPCCYQLELRASKRTIASCSGSHQNLSQYSFGVL